ncbi:unnamed protein product, partial [Mesorhabditis spiculigera]
MKDQAVVVGNKDGAVLVKYAPKSAGFHELIVRHDGETTGTPLKFFVESETKSGATASGPGLHSAHAGVPATFDVYTKTNEDSELSVSIEGPKQAPISIVDHEHGVCSVTWTPSVAGLYKIHVQLGARPLADSPYSVAVTADRDEEAHHPANSTEFSISVPQAEDLGSLTATIKSASGRVEPCGIRIIGDGRLGVTFVPREHGVHWINVYRDGQALAKGPFKFKVDKSQLGDASRVKIQGNHSKHIQTHQLNEILVNTADAGYGSLAVSIQGPSKANLVCKEVEPGLIAVRYRVNDPGSYKVNVKFAEQHVKESPISITCTQGEDRGSTNGEQAGAWDGSEVENGDGVAVSFNSGDATKVRAHGPGLHKFIAGKPASFNVDTGAAGPNLLMVGVVTSAGPCEEVVVKHMGAGHFVVNYKIDEPLRGLVFVRYGDSEVPGSPFAINSH